MACYIYDICNDHLSRSSVCCIGPGGVKYITGLSNKILYFKIRPGYTPESVCNEININKNKASVIKSITINGIYDMVKISVCFETPSFKSSGETYEYVYGQDFTPVQWFLLSNKIFGPCWMTFKRLFADESFLKVSNISYTRTKKTMKLNVCITDGKQRKIYGFEPTTNDIYSLNETYKKSLVYDILVYFEETGDENAVIYCNLKKIAIKTMKSKTFKLIDLVADYQDPEGYNEECDLSYIVRLLKKSQCIPLAFSMAKISGNLVRENLYCNQSAQVEMILMHKFHEYDIPIPNGPIIKPETITGGLALTPTIGLYYGRLVMLDFISLYPSIIVENNFDIIPNDTNISILPNIVRNLIERRNAVKKINEIEQLSLKKATNSIYGCLGMSKFRFFNPILANKITAFGRTAITNAKKIATVMGLTVLYGDTDSILVNVDENNEKILIDKINNQYNYLRIKVDYILSKIFIKCKKQYIGHSETGQVIERGMYSAKRNVSIYCSKYMITLVEKILANEKDLDKLIIKPDQNSIVPDFIEYNILGKNSEDYTNNSIFVNLAKQRNLKRGDVLATIHTTSGLYCYDTDSNDEEYIVDIGVYNKQLSNAVHKLLSVLFDPKILSPLLSNCFSTKSIQVNSRIIDLECRIKCVCGDYIDINNIIDNNGFVFETKHKCGKYPMYHPDVLKSNLSDQLNEFKTTMDHVQYCAMLRKYSSTFNLGKCISIMDEKDRHVIFEKCTFKIFDTLFKELMDIVHDKMYCIPTETVSLSLMFNTINK
jgi:hypothetical protein